MKYNSLRLLFCTILFPNHISGLFSQGQDMSLPGTKQQSGVDGGYPAESAVRCDKLMANLTRRCCQAGRGGSCSTRDSLLLPRTLMWHGNLFQASLRRCLRALMSPERWGMDGGGAETSCRSRAPWIWVSKEARLLMIALKDEFHTTEGENPCFTTWGPSSPRNGFFLPKHDNLVTVSGVASSSAAHMFRLV